MSEKNYYALFDKPTPQNLEANQRGRLTPEQQSVLENASRGQRSSLVFFGAAILVFVGFIAFFFWRVVGVDSLFSSTSLVTIGFVMLGVTILLLFLTGGDPLILIPRDEIENGQVESAIGKVKWTGTRYKFVSDSRKLQSLRSSGRPLPPPGDYRIYCLPRSGLVVMAEELGLLSASQPKELLLETLASANRFSMDDLEANRTGSLSGRQEIRLFGYASLLGVFLLIFIWISMFAVQSPTMDDNLLVIAFLAMMAVLMFLRLGWGSLRVVVDIWGGEVKYMDGLVTRHIRRGRNTRYYLYQLGDIKFRVSKSAFNALIEGREYRVYFTPRSKRLVAIEPK